MIFTGNIGYDTEIKNCGPTESHLQALLEHLLQLANSSELKGESEGIQIIRSMHILIFIYSRY